MGGILTGSKEGRSIPGKKANREHCLLETLSKWGRNFLNEIKWVFLVEEAQSGYWAITRNLPHW